MSSTGFKNCPERSPSGQVLSSICGVYNIVLRLSLFGVTNEKIYTEKVYGDGDLLKMGKNRTSQRMYIGNPAYHPKLTTPHTAANL
jgi:hypothetical protein